MNKWKIKDQKEFEERQMPLFDFVTNLAIRAAREVAQHIAATVRPWWKAFQARIASRTKKANQLILELEGIYSTSTRTITEDAIQFHA